MKQEKQPFLDQLKPELDKLNIFTQEGCRKLLEHLNEKHCTEKIELTDENFQMINIKKTVLKFLIMFHPDKNHDKGKKLQVLYEEITKALNHFYEVYK